MHADVERYLAWLGAYGAAPARGPDPVRLPDQDGPVVVGDAAVQAFPLPTGELIQEHRDPSRGVAADHATALVAHALGLPPVRVAGREVWEVGCGTGVLLVAAARAGARHLVGTDVDPACLALARATLEAAGVVGELIETSLVDGIPAGRRADLMLVNLPHKPVPEGFELRTYNNGGVDGAAVHTAFAETLDARLTDDGQVLVYLHSLPNPRVLARYADTLDLTLLAWRRRFVQPGEFGALDDVFRSRADAGESLILRDAGREYLFSGVWLGARR